MFRTIFTTLRALLKSGLCGTQLCIRSDTASYDTKEMKLRQKLFHSTRMFCFRCHIIWETSEAFESNCQLVSRPNGWVRYPRWAFSGLITIIGGIRRIVSQGAKLALPLMIAVWALLIKCGCGKIWTRFFSSLAFQHCLHPASRNPSQISRWHHLTLISY